LRDGVLEVHFDGRAILSKDDFYAAVRAIEETPDWFYGHVRDALFDLVLAVIEGPFVLHWTHAEVSAASMGLDFDQIVEVLKDAQAEPRSKFQLRLSEGASDPHIDKNTTE